METANNNPGYSLQELINEHRSTEDALKSVCYGLATLVGAKLTVADKYILTPQAGSFIPKPILFSSLELCYRTLIKVLAKKYPTYKSVFVPIGSSQQLNLEFAQYHLFYLCFDQSPVYCTLERNTYSECRLQIDRLIYRGDLKSVIKDSGCYFDNVLFPSTLTDVRWSGLEKELES